MNKIDRIDSFVRTLSTDRFDRYLGLAGGKTDRALDLYSCNACLSQALYVPLQVLEITLRNSMHECLAANIEEYWFDKPNVIVVKNQIEQIGAAKAKLIHEKKDVSSGGIVAALPFGFWTSMFKPGYEELWRHHLCRIVISEKREGITRKTFSGPLEPIRNIRNRVAHHECIIELNLQNHYFKIRDLLNLLAPEARYWMEKHSIFENSYRQRKALLDELHGKERKDARAADAGT